MRNEQILVFVSLKWRNNCIDASTSSTSLKSRTWDVRIYKSTHLSSRESTKVALVDQKTMKVIHEETQIQRLRHVSEANFLT